MKAPEWKECWAPQEASCDGEWHYWSVWDEDTRQSYPRQAHCPHWEGNNKILSLIERTVDMYYRFKHSDEYDLGVEDASYDAARSLEVDPDGLIDGPFVETTFDHAVEDAIEQQLLREFFG